MTSAPPADPLEHTASDEVTDDADLTPTALGHSLAVLGMIAFSELATFSRLAADAAAAPSLDQRLELSRLAGVALDRLSRVGARVVELGGELQPVMAPFAGVLVEFDQRTVPSTWGERLLKGYVGYGVSDDFGRIIAKALDPRTGDLVATVLSDDGHSRFVVESLAQAATVDATLASRLALWGRRLVGEALGVVQGVIADHPELADLLDLAMADVPGNGDVQQRLFAELTAEHSRRMERLGLTP
ncbi:ferritin-like fold-containing protein [Cellulomonas sp. KRMCY2]|uniref:ferritin-like fold-containing protein n=1 Tax=Cellulomonas sp. KRMCY2 TaxID=1304865 RepID=UPI00045E8F05|nr:ferritin-like fold-containing protein [Cellulomonas sp. KRMCY2]